MQYKVKDNLMGNLKNWNICITGHDSVKLPHGKVAIFLII